MLGILNGFIYKSAGSDDEEDQCFEPAMMDVDYINMMSIDSDCKEQIMLSTDDEEEKSFSEFLSNMGFLNDYIISPDENDERKRHEVLKELALMVNSSLSSEPDGSSIERLRAHFAINWSIHPDLLVRKYDFPTFEKFLECNEVKEYIEISGFTDKGGIVYSAKSFPQNEHILRRINDEKLTAEQREKRRKQQRLIALKKPENTEAFIEGKKRILGILLELQAYETPVSFQQVQDLYLQKYNVSLNNEEQTKLFQNKSAVKNFERAFFHEVIIKCRNPIFIMLKSKDVKMPEEITDEDRALISNVTEVSSYPLIDETKFNKTTVRPNFCSTKEAISTKHVEENEVEQEILLKDARFRTIEESPAYIGEECVTDRSVESQSFAKNIIVEREIDGKLTKADDKGKYTDDNESEDSDERNTTIRNRRKKYIISPNLDSEKISKLKSITARSLRKSVGFEKQIERRNLYDNEHMLKQSGVTSVDIESNVTMEKLDGIVMFDQFPNNCRDRYASQAPQSISHKHTGSIRAVDAVRYKTLNIRSEDSQKFLRKVGSFLMVDAYTQTDSDWLEQILDEYGILSKSINHEISNTSSENKEIVNLALTIEMVAKRRSPQPLLLSSLPQLIGTIYGCPVDPLSDQNYRMSWKNIILNFCSSLQLITLPNGQDLIILND
ncbi:unnamed protein product [Dracunculus medinensis]|uniref:Nuclear factor related to kappa-B-binding protein n=1 Tax=Dracunculus medinensis TaxID=318479 RepID=A0A0N4UC90_DRAME|nr:unnamed protein product [Dracunculus medinensis]